MGFRFQKRISLSKYLRLNFSKTGVSVSIGKRGLDLSIKGDQVTGNIGLPGTGFSYRGKLTPKTGEQIAQSEQTDTQERSLPNRTRIFFVLFSLLAALYAYLKASGTA